MTREEALEILDTIPTIGEQVDALEMAIEALQTPPISQRSMYQAGYRQAQEDRPKGEWVEREVDYHPKAIEAWQSARCSVCGHYHTTPYLYYFYTHSYCPTCGAKMDGERSEE